MPSEKYPLLSQLLEELLRLEASEGARTALRDPERREATRRALEELNGDGEGRGEGGES